MYHGGRFSDNFYVGGDIAYFDYVDKELYDEDVGDMYALVPEFKEIEIYLEHLDYDVEDFLKSKESQSCSTVEKKCKVLIKEIYEEHPLAIIPSGSKVGVDTEVENGCDIEVETGNDEALVRERRRIGKGKAVVTEPYDSCDGYPSENFRLVDTGYVMHKNDDIDLNTLVGDDWLGGISFTNTQGRVAHEFASDAITKATNGRKKDTNGPDQGANGHPRDGPGPEKGGNKPENGATSDFKPLEDIEEGHHINAELWATSDGEEGGSTKRFTEYNLETDNYDLQFELGIMFSNCHWWKWRQRTLGTWFLELLAADIGIVNSHWWLFISDRQKGLPGAFEDVVRNVKHHFYVRHLFSKFKHEAVKPPSYSRHSGRLKKLRRNEAEEKFDKAGKKWFGKQGLAMRYSHCGE
ncbi:PREDICTED: OSJNBb0026L04 1 [Prunus dulcis]|uniref:PREDICTED: OSJNBb0026L04 1 n=1 Tax=Prunus dulcis TaxID=3755 RepID=A0A5E4EVY3_PRUDU|nr:PREDICTED: OSJNBb0026L04 1 [Prunus dulcis]